MYDVITNEEYIYLGFSLSAALSYARRLNGYAFRPATGERVYPDANNHVLAYVDSLDGGSRVIPSPDPL